VSMIECDANEVLLDALIRHEVPVAFCCKAGLCGMCKTEVIAGQVHNLPSSARALPAEEASRGWILTCCAKPASSCSLRPLNSLHSVGPDYTGLLSTLQGFEVGSSDFPGARKVLRLRADAAEGFTRFHAGHWARLFELDRPSVSYLACFIDQAPDGGALFSIAEKTTAEYPQLDTRAGKRLYVDGPRGVAFEHRGFDEPTVLMVDQHGLALLEALTRSRASPVAPLMPLLVLISEHALKPALIQSRLMALLTRRLLWFSSCEEGQESVRRELGLLAKQTAETGRRLKLLLRGAPAFQDRMRKVAAGTGVRAWDVNTEYLLNLTQTTENIESENDKLP